MGLHLIGTADRVVRYYLPLVLWMALITVCSSLSPSAYPKVSWALAPKAVHVVFYFCLALLFHRALMHQTTLSVSERSSLALSLILTSICGIIDETHQVFTPGRHPRISDIGIDAASAAAFVLVAWVIQMYQMRSQVPSR